MEITLFRQNAAAIHDAMADSESPPCAPMARMIATGPVQEKRNATTAVAAYCAPKSAAICRGAGTGNSGRSSSMLLVLAPLESVHGAPRSHPKIFFVRAARGRRRADRFCAAPGRAGARRVRGPALRA